MKRLEVGVFLEERTNGENPEVSPRLPHKTLTGHPGDLWCGEGKLCPQEWRLWGWSRGSPCLLGLGQHPYGILVFCSQRVGSPKKPSLVPTWQDYFQVTRWSCGGDGVGEGADRQLFRYICLRGG